MLTTSLIEHTMKMPTRYQSLKTSCKPASAPVCAALSSSPPLRRCLLDGSCSVVALLLLRVRSLV